MTTLHGIGCVLSIAIPLSLQLQYQVALLLSLLFVVLYLVKSSARSNYWNILVLTVISCCSVLMDCSLIFTRCSRRSVDPSDFRRPCREQIVAWLWCVDWTCAHFAEHISLPDEVFRCLFVKLSLLSLLFNICRYTITISNMVAQYVSMPLYLFQGKQFAVWLHPFVTPYLPSAPL